MKWRFTIAIWTFVLISFSSSAPVIIQNDMAVMYPMEYYPAYMQTDYVNIDFSKWFRKAADSVKHFYNYVNHMIFGEIEREPIFVRYPTFKENTDVADDPHDVSTVHPQQSDVNFPRIQFFEMRKDADGNIELKKLNDPNGNVPASPFIPSGVESNRPANSLRNDGFLFHQMSGGIVRNPFQWNKTLEKDTLFSGAFQNYAVNPQLLWNSGIFPFQPMNAFNVMGVKVSDQNQASENQSSQPPNSSDKSQNSEISSQTQTIDQNQPSDSTTDQPEISTITEESQRDETVESLDSLNSSNDEKLSDEDSVESRPYEISMDIERIKQNNSDSDETHSLDHLSSDESETSGTTQASDVSDETNSLDHLSSEESETSGTTQASDVSDETNDEDDDDNDNEDDNDNDDEDGTLTEFETNQLSSDDESDQRNQEPETTEKSTQQVTNDENKSSDDDDDLTIVETSAPSEVTEKVEITEKTSDVEINTKIDLGKQDSNESDIAKRVLAIVQP